VSLTSAHSTAIKSTMGRMKQSRPIKRRRVMLEADDSVVAEEQTTLLEQGHVEDGGEEELAKAIELLRKTPPDQVEAAAAEATRMDLDRHDRWIHLRLPTVSVSSSLSPVRTITTATVFDDKHIDNASLPRTNMPKRNSTGADKNTINDIETISTKTTMNSPVFNSQVPSWLRGLGFARLGTEDFIALKKLHQIIKDRINQNRDENTGGAPSSSKLEWASWSGSIDDPRKRAFGFLPQTWGYDPEIRNNRLDITMPMKQAIDGVAENDRIRNKRSMVVLEESEVPEGVEEAIQNVCQKFRTCLLSKKNDFQTTSENCDDLDNRHRLAQFLRYENLIAAQPNLHSGRALLPVHLDDPRKDGFGVIIVTIGMEGIGTILLRDARGIHRGVAMRLEAGEAYMLSDRSRDSCAHGVLAEGCTSPSDDSRATIPWSERESLNLRFGLHDLMPPSRSKCVSSDELSSALPIVPANMVLRHWEG